MVCQLLFLQFNSKELQRQELRGDWWKDAQPLRVVRLAILYLLADFGQNACIDYLQEVTGRT